MGRLKPLPYREVKRRLESKGFAEAGQKGSHVKFARRSIPVGTLRSILHQAHIDLDIWEQMN